MAFAAPVRHSFLGGRQPSTLEPCMRLSAFWWVALLASCFAPCVHAGKSAVRNGPWSVKLKRQMIPLHSSGGVVQHKSAYYGEVFLSGPSSEAFAVVFDTGSGHLVLPSTICKSDTCMAHRRYKRRASLLAQDIDVDGSLVMPGEMRDQITVSFGTGEVTGVFVQDRVCLGDPIFAQVPEKQLSSEFGASLLQVGKISPPNNTTVVSESEESAAPLPVISASDAMALAAAAKGQLPKAGPALEVVRAAARAVYQREKGDGCVDLRMVAATDMTHEPFSSFEFDGILGLGLPGLSQTPEFNFLETAAAMGAWTPMPGAQRTFSVFLAISEEEQSEITFGGWEVSHMRDGEDFTWNYIRDPLLGYWHLEVFGITANGNKTDFCNDGSCRAVVDTGTSLVGVPSSLGRQLGAALRFDANPDGLCDAPQPVLEIDLGNFTVVLDPTDYARPEMSKQQMNSVVDTQMAGEGAAATKLKQACVPMLMHIDLPEPLGPKTLILGEPVLQRYYTAFDAGAKRIGFVTARHDGMRRPARVFA